MHVSTQDINSRKVHQNDHCYILCDQVNMCILIQTNNNKDGNIKQQIANGNEIKSSYWLIATVNFPDYLRLDHYL